MREPAIYGRATLDDVQRICRQAAERRGFVLHFRQSTTRARWSIPYTKRRQKKAAGLIINAGAYTHTSIALRDAVAAVDLSVVEVHVSNIFAREDFRHTSHIAPVAKATLCGFGINGYALAIEGLATLFARARRSQKDRDGIVSSERKNNKPKRTVDHDLIRELARLLDEVGLTEKSNSSATDSACAWRDTLQQSMQQFLLPRAPPHRSIRVATSSPGLPIRRRHPGLVSSPMVGTAYSLPRTWRAAFRGSGSRIAVGDTLLIVEAMKTMNPIPSPHAGTVIQVWLRTGNPSSSASH
jgi:3-dehydroquinate dehydratase-2